MKKGKKRGRRQEQLFLYVSAEFLSKSSDKKNSKLYKIELALFYGISILIFNFLETMPENYYLVQSMLLLANEGIGGDCLMT